MAMYEWICRDCNIWWDRDLKLGTAPKRTKCPKCGKLCSRYYQQQNVAVSFKDDGAGNAANQGVNDFHTIRRRYQKFAQDGYDKDSANTFLHGQIKASKNAMDDESFRYKSAQIDWHKYAESRGLKKVGDKEAQQKVKNAKRLTEDAYDRANKQGYKDIGSTKLDIAKPNKNEPKPQK
jgi:hypothetical protein